jgi:hypothetical protein
MTTSRVHAHAPLDRRFVPAQRWSRLLRGTLVATGAIVLLGIFVAPDRVWPSVLVSTMYFVGLSLAGMLFLAFHYVTTAGWSVSIKRVAEAMASTLPAAAGLVGFMLCGMGVLYEWTHSEIVAGDPILMGKSGWLNAPFFIGRAGIVLAVWLLFYWALIRSSRRQDATGGLAINHKCTALSAGFLVAFAITFSVASFDWLMSLQPHWYSTIFAVYNFAGSFVSGLAVITIAAIVLRRQGTLAGIVTRHHLHDLGKLLMGFTTFWIYIWFSQYMLIWYGNLPEEVTYYTWRHDGAWAVLSTANLLANWAIPFLVLLPRPAKSDESRLLRICALLLVGRWLDLYLMVQPVFEKHAPVLGLWEIATLVGAAALFMVFLRRGLAATNLVPRGDPYLQESLQHHQ